MEPNGDCEAYDVDQFGIVLVTACDVQGVARGRFVFGKSVPGVVKNGLGMTQAALFCGVTCDIPSGLTDYKEAGWTNGTMMPDIATLKPISWLSNGSRKVGHVLCDLLDNFGQREVSCPRELALRQIDSLKSLGYSIVASHDLEFTIFHKGTLNPVGLNEDTSKLQMTLMRCLLGSGFRVTSVARGTEAGKLLISLGSQKGITAFDDLHRLHCILKSLCVKEGFDITYMTQPLPGISGNRSIYRYSLFAEDERNVFADADSVDNLSAVARHWMAGLLCHHGAITALARPTWNCYSCPDREDFFQNSWTADKQNSTCRLQFQTSGCNVSITDRLPSSASNPYTVIGAFIGAGIDGIINKLELHEKVENVQPTPPTSLPEALLSLEKDQVFQNAIGPKFVHRFLLLKREFEVARFTNRTAGQDCKDILDFEHFIYLRSL